MFVTCISVTVANSTVGFTVSLGYVGLSYEILNINVDFMSIMH